MKIYIAGKITDNPNYMEEFAQAEQGLKAKGNKVINPTILPVGFKYEDYMHICFAMINICDAVFLLDNWKDSSGAVREVAYARATQKIIFESESLNRLRLLLTTLPEGLFR